MKVNRGSGGQGPGPLLNLGAHLSLQLMGVRQLMDKVPLRQAGVFGGWGVKWWLLSLYIHTHGGVVAGVGRGQLFPDHSRETGGKKNATTIRGSVYITYEPSGILRISPFLWMLWNNLNQICMILVVVKRGFFPQITVKLFFYVMGSD